MKTFLPGLCGGVLWAALAAAAVLAGSLAGRAQDLSEEERGAGFVSLFNGRDFTGWQFDGGASPPAELPTNWQVADGVIRLSGGGKPHLGSDQAFGDFELRFEWRALRDKYNSGFFLRSGRKVGANQINLAQGHEGSFIGPKLDGAKAVPELQKPAGEWNTWRVLVVGDKVTYWCNGQLAWEATGLKPAQGHIGFQAEGAALEFRNIRIRAIK